MQQLDRKDDFEEPASADDLGFNPNAALGEQQALLFAAAGRGDIGALRALRDQAASLIGPPIEQMRDGLAVAAWAVITARMVAANGDQVDAEILGIILGFAGDVYCFHGMYEVAGSYYIESLGLSDRLAVIGSKSAGIFAGKLAAALPSIVMQEAKQVSRPEIH